MSGVRVVAIHSPGEYEPRQLEQAVAIAAQLDRGLFIYCMPPVQWPPR